MPKSKFLDIIESQRKKKSKEKFDGNFLDYLNIVEKNSSTYCLSHKMLYDVITNNGVSIMPSDDPRKRKIFDNENICKGSIYTAW